MQCLCLDLLAFEVGIRVVEVENDRTLVKFSDEELWPLAHGGFY